MKRQPLGPIFRLDPYFPSAPDEGLQAGHNVINKLNFKMGPSP